MTSESTPTPAQPMTPRAWIVVILRGLGMWTLINAFEQLITAVNVGTGVYHPSLTDAKAFLNHAMVLTILAAWLLIKAPGIAGFLAAMDRVAERNAGADNLKD